ncbi:MAG TPA: FAD-linked oxidase C-terminal domain-containing protein [Thermoplasmata archaeon]|nr:FAD-linked oxidase C-terminal domain-containing protein [Thermoplasmata archaeon]
MGLPGRTEESLERLLGARVRFPDGASRSSSGSSPAEPSGAPCVVRPTRAADVVRLVRWARVHRIGLVARGGGTSLVGGATAGADQVQVDFSEWTLPARVDPVAQRATIGPGTITAEVSRISRRHGLFYPPNPGSWRRSTIGGNAATNAGGPRSFRYGTTLAWVAGVRAVLGNGGEVALGSASRKRSAGPELLGLLIGSEGTLGLFTELTVRLAPLPLSRTIVIAPLPRRPDLGGAVRRLTVQRSAPISAVEYLDATCASYLEERMKFDPGGGGLLLIEVEGGERGARIDAVVAALRRSGVRAPFESGLPPDRLWDLRGDAGVQLDRELARRLREDVAVPVRRLNELIRGIAEIGRRFRVGVATFGHIGDANLHPNFVLDPESPAAARLRRALWSTVRRLGGTVSGEHGIGQVKRSEIERELGVRSVAWLGAVKRFCDPDGILNPGKLFP